VMGEIVGFSPTSEIDGRGAQHIGGGRSHPSALVVWVELGLVPCCCGLRCT
jgi:hypothetical protein